MIVEKGKLVIIDYETIVDDKIIDSSKLHKPLEIVYGYTKINKVMDKNIKGKEKGHKFEIKHKIDKNPIILEFNYSDFDEQEIENMRINKNFSLNESYLDCELLEANEDKNIIRIKQTDPFADKTIIHKLKIKDIKEIKKE